MFNKRELIEKDREFTYNPDKNYFGYDKIESFNVSISYDDFRSKLKEFSPGCEFFTDSGNFGEVVTLIELNSSHKDGYPMINVAFDNTTIDYEILVESHDIGEPEIGDESEISRAIEATIDFYIWLRENIS